MKNYRKINNIEELKIGDIVRVYGKVRRKYTDEYRNFPGRIGKAVALHAPLDLARRVRAVLVLFEGLPGEWMVELKNLYIKIEKKEDPLPIPQHLPVETAFKGLKEIQNVMKEIRKARAEKRDRIAGDYLILGADIARAKYLCTYTGVAKVGFVFDNGDIAFSTNTACHAGLRGNIQLFRENKCAFIASYVCTDKELPECSKAFYTWLFNSSVWKDCFFTKSPEEAFETGIILNTNQPNNLIASACMASRHPTEFPSHCRAWYIMVKEGMPEDVAYLISLCIKEYGGSLNYFQLYGHVPFPASIRREGVQRFLNKKMFKEEVGPNYYDKSTYQKVSDLFDNYNDVGTKLESKVEGVFNKHLKDMQHSKVNNPFGAKAQGLRTVDAHDFIQDILKEEMFNV